MTLTFKKTYLAIFAIASVCEHCVGHAGLCNHKRLYISLEQNYMKDVICSCKNIRSQMYRCEIVLIKWFCGCTFISEMVTSYR